MTKSGQSIFKPALAEEIFSKEDFVGRKISWNYKIHAAVITGCQWRNRQRNVENNSLKMEQK